MEIYDYEPVGIADCCIGFVFRSRFERAFDHWPRVLGSLAYGPWFDHGVYAKVAVATTHVVQEVVLSLIVASYGN